MGVGTRHGRLLAGLAGAAALAAIGWADPAGAAEPVVTGTPAVGATITVSSDDATSCDAGEAEVQLGRVTGPDTSVAIVNGSTNLVAGQPWQVSLTIPATDLQGTPLQPGDELVVRSGGICNAFGDQFAFVLDDVFLTLGSPASPSTTAPPDPAPTTPTTAGAPPTPAPTAGAAATTATAAASGAEATLPRTGGAALPLAATGALAIGGGLGALAFASRRPRHRTR